MIGMTVCSGIGAPELAAPWVDWRYQSEIEPFPCAVLKERFPYAENLGDMTKFQEWKLDTAIDVLCGGTPCQSFSIAGLRKGLDDPRGNLMLTYLALAERFNPRWLVWENVPGVLSANEGRDFGAFLAGLGQLGYGFAYRVLDAQYTRTRGFPYAVPQRRRRVFVVGYLGDWRRAAAVLFDAESLRGNPAPRREAGQAIAGTLGARTCRSIGAQDAQNGHLIADWPKEVAPTLNAHFGDKMGLEDQHALNGAGLFVPCGGGALPEADLSPCVAFHPMQTPISSEGACHAISANATAAVAWSIMPQNSGKDYKARLVQVAQPLMAGGPVGGNQGGDYIQDRPWAVRRLTPTECERLMGFPDGWTKIAWRGKDPENCPDGPRYKALGNSWAVNCGEYLFDRIKLVEAMS